MPAVNRILVCAFFLIPILRKDLYSQVHAPEQEPVKVIFYFNSKWELTTQEKSFYRREAYFDLVNAVFDGVYSDYRENKLIADGSYHHGVKSGIHSEYNDDLSIKSKIEYSADDFTLWEWNGGSDGAIKNGTGKFTIRFFYFIEEDAQLIRKQGWLTGEFANGKRIGHWIYSDTHHVKTDEETYARGKFQKRVHFLVTDSIETNVKKPVYLSLVPLNTEALIFDESSFTNLNQFFERYVTYPPSFHRDITYPGGIKRLIAFITQMVTIPDQYLEIIQVKVDEHGQLIKTGIVRSVDFVTDERVMEATLIHEKRLLPAIKNGKPYAKKINLPVSGGKKWVELLEEMPDEWFLDYSNFSN